MSCASFAVMGTPMFMVNNMIRRPICSLLISSSRNNSTWREKRQWLMENKNENPNKDKPDWISQRKHILDAHKNRRLKLAIEMGDGPVQYKFRPNKVEQETIIKTNDRKLNRLQDELPPYESYTKEEIHDYEKGTTYWDPLFNPHLHEERNRVDPDEEPFNAIYAGNEQTEGAKQYTSVKNVTTPELWSFVEQLSRHKIAPQVPTRKLGEPVKPMPSGFIPPPEEAPDLPYFIPRTRNYLLPVYYNLSNDPEECFTFVKNVQGDLWLLEEHLRKHLESLDSSENRMISFVREPDEQVGFRGRHLKPIVDWLHAQGF